MAWKSREGKLPPTQFFADVLGQLIGAYPEATLDREVMLGLRDFMINRCRPFIFATAPSPIVAACVRAALKIIEAADDRRAELMSRIDFAGAELRRLCAIEPSGSQIQPIIVGADVRATTLASRLQTRGYDIRAIRPPTVPEGAARLRIALTLNTRKEDVARMIAHLGEELARLEP
mgnify:CR=1 FL=1